MSHSHGFNPWDSGIRQGLQAAFAQDNDLSAAYVNDVLRGRREPGKKILDAVGVERITVYRLKEGDGA